MNEFPVVIKLPERRAFYYRNGTPVVAHHFKWEMFDGNLIGRPCTSEGVPLKMYPYHFCEDWQPGVEGASPMSLDEAKEYGR